MICGLGDDSTTTSLPACSSITVPAGFVGPINCDSTNGGVNYAASQTQVANLNSTIQSLESALNCDPNTMVCTPTTTSTVTAGVSTPTFILGLAGVVALMLLMKK